MQTTTLLYIVLAVLLSVSVAFFQYFYKNKDKRTINTLLFVLKTLSLFLLGLLLINPKITIQETENVKPTLAVLADNSLSTKYFKETEKVGEWLQNFKNNNRLNNKFNIEYFSFGERINSLDSLSFNESQTDIYEAIESVNELNKNNLSTTVLLTDGNQTIGNDYEFFTSDKKTFPVVLGDTVTYKDVRITQLNVNKYSYIKNKFPVEAFLQYEGDKPVNTQFSIYKNGITIFSQKVTFTPENNTKTIQANLTSTKEGLHYYTASVRKLESEKNTKNNTKRFSVEVIDEQTKVLVLASILHPDLGAFKKSIESNKQRKVDLFLVNNFKGELKDYQLVIFYQPNQNFRKYLQEQTSNFLLVSGVNTYWNFLNSFQLGFTKNSINQSEEYAPVYNDQFLTFYQKDIGFNDFPPLQDKFGEVKLQSENQVLLQQNVGGIETNQPLLATLEKGEDKMAVLFGEGIWKWRATSFRQTNSFQDFDEFIGNLVQYLASNKKRKRLEVTAESLYPANSSITISAFYVDKNYKFDSRASLLLTLTNTETKEKKTIPFSLANNSFQVVLENLTSGDYSYKVSVDGQNINSYGKFKITDYQVEEQFTNANKTKLQKLADKTGGKLYYPNQQEGFIDELMNDKAYYTVQKSNKKEQDLIDWKWILFFVVGLLSTEWFIRKYYGKI